MNENSHHEGWATPFEAPLFPPPPSNYHGVEFMSVYFRVDPGDLASLLPAPLQPSPLGRCCAFAINVDFCADYGPFKEMGLAIGCTHEGQEAFFLSCLFLDNADAVAAGREIYGSPKKPAEIRMVRQGGEITSTAIRADVPMIQLNMNLSEPALPGDVPALWPFYVLKIIPAAEGQRAAIKQLLLSPQPENVSTSRLYKGNEVVSFTPTVAGDFWRLRPVSFDGAYYQLLNGYSQGFSTVVKDYLAP